MFYEKFYELCKKRGVSPGAAAMACGIAKSRATDWKNGSKPRPSSLKKLAEYFGVSVEYWSSKETPAAESDGLDGLDREFTDRLRRLTPEEWAKVDAFVQGLLASR